jgi:glutamine cyclotransferase
MLMSFSSRRVLPLTFCLLAAALACGTDATNGGPPAAGGAGGRAGASNMSNSNASQQQPAVYGYELVNAWPHDRAAFTQGLVLHDGKFLESTGQYGQSSLRRVEMETGRVLQKVDVAPQYFAEGMTLLGGKIYQLTWENQLGFIYDPATFERTGTFRYDGQGWGLTSDGRSLILSDGTSQLRFIDPETFAVRRTVNVTDRGRPVRDLNELEYVKGEIFANVWHMDRIARIDPETGRVTGWIDLSGLLPPAERGGSEAVLNGIAYDADADRLFVTGKLWPKLFEIRVKERR